MLDVLAGYYLLVPRSGLIVVLLQKVGFADLEKRSVCAVPFGSVLHQFLKGGDAFPVLLQFKIGPADIVEGVVEVLAVGIFLQQGSAFFYGALVLAAFIKAVDQPVAGQFPHLWGGRLGFGLAEIGGRFYEVGRCPFGELALAFGVALIGGAALGFLGALEVAITRLVEGDFLDWGRNLADRDLNLRGVEQRAFNGIDALVGCDGLLVVLGGVEFLRLLERSLYFVWGRYKVRAYY